MEKTIITMGLISALMGLLGCGNKPGNKTSAQDGTIQTMNIKDIHYGIPTIENVLPDFEAKEDSTNMKMHEDDWRQIEFVPRSQRAGIDTEIAAIRNIYEHHSSKADDYMTFTDMAVRHSITQPLSLDFSKVKAYLSDQDIKWHGLSLINNSGQVLNGFSFSAGGLDYYGQFDENKRVKWLCIYSLDSDKKDKSSLDKIAKLLAGENLYLVNWCRMQVMDETNIRIEYK